MIFSVHLLGAMGKYPLDQLSEILLPTYLPNNPATVNTLSRHPAVLSGPHQNLKFLHKNPQAYM